MKRKMIVAGSLAMLMLGVAAAHASDGSLSSERLDAVLEKAAAFGFQHYQEIEAKGGDNVKIEGWLDDEWQAEVRLSLETGQTLEEERKRREGGAWGMSEDDVRMAMVAAVAEGMVEFEEIEVDRDGSIEIEGRDADGREIEVKARQGESGVVEVKRD
ncbi:PepSY domain-containing protein [Billgrantia desiderata]|nr:PepSY domain-containing protein [Halomonas desiderata]